MDPCALWPGPPGPQVGGLVPDLPLMRLDGEGEVALSLHGMRAGCGEPGLLVVRIEPAWCDPCGRRADRFGGLMDPFEDKWIRAATVLYAGPDNAPPTAADLAAWRAAHPGLPGGVARAVDGGARSLVRAYTMVPLVLLIDARTMKILSAERAPGDRALQEAVAKALPLAGGPEVELGPADTTLVDGRFDGLEWGLIQAMGKPPEPLPSPSNAHADDPAAAALGQALFFDKDLAGTGGISCASCHDPGKGYADGLPVAEGVAKGRLNSPTIAGAAAQRWFFWDGRADSLWSQALGPLENPIETGGSRLHVAHRIKDAHAAAYEATFGPLPDLGDLARFPADGKPGDPSFDGMSAADQEAVTRVFVNVGKAIEAHERALPAAKIRLSDYAAGDLEALSPAERDGLQGFLRSGCVSCHWGPGLTDGAFHDLLVPSSAPPADQGRIAGLAALLASPFRKDGLYSDDPSAQPFPASLLPVSEMLGQVKTPSLRGVALTGPWGHGGTFGSLESVAKHYLTVRILPPKGELVAGELDAASGSVPGNLPALVAFLQMLGGQDGP